MRTRRHAVEASNAEVCLELAMRLNARRHEIEETILARLRSAAAPGVTDVAGIRSAVAGALTYGIDAIAGRGGNRLVPPPAELIFQVRFAARRKVPLDALLRYLLTGRAVVNEFLVLECGDRGHRSGALTAVLKAGAAADRLVEAVAAEYRLEVQAGMKSPRHRRSEYVRQLLAGSLVAPVDLGYKLEEWNLGVVGAGDRAEEVIRSIAASQGRLLLISEEDEVWAWFGGRTRFEAGMIAGALQRLLADDVSLALGEAGQGLTGWRLTHRQARAAMIAARRWPGRVIRYADVMLTVAALGDELLVTSLHQLYLDPLERERDGGLTLSETLRAYFASGRNVSSAAASLGITRRTVANRLRAAEKRLGFELTAAAGGLEVALQIAPYRGGPPSTQVEKN